MKKPRRERKLCTACHVHRALSRYRGVFAWRKDHPLCSLCFRSLRDRTRLSFLTQAPASAPLAGSVAAA